MATEISPLSIGNIHLEKGLCYNALFILGGDLNVYCIQGGGGPILVLYTPYKYGQKKYMGVAEGVISARNKLEV